MSSTNIALLTRSHKAIAAKKRAKRDQIKEVVFDDDARREFLTGFHKRKLAKAEAARAKAKEREKQERLEARREQRRILREQALENASTVEKAYGAILDGEDDEEWTGIGSSKAEDNERDEEYEDEEMLATVTVVEDFDPDTIIHGPPKPEPSTEPSISHSESKPSQPLPSKSTHQSATKNKTREKTIRYETKDARRKEQTKQRARRTEKAELAGGKASRKNKSSRGGKGKHGSKR